MPIRLFFVPLQIFYAIADFCFMPVRFFLNTDLVVFARPSG
jgi:hypothetical protein